MQGRSIVIRQIRIRNWRAYRDATINLGHPIVFFVAPNGVGKSSLYEAARNCLLGFPRGVAARRGIRAGSDDTEISMDFSVEEGADISVTRSLRRTGYTTFSATQDGQSIDEAAFTALLERSWLADPALLERLAFGDLDSKSKSGRSLPIREHLADLLGVTPLLEVARQMKEAQKAAVKTVANHRVVVEGSDRALALAAAALADADDEYEEANAALRALQPRLTEAERAAAQRTAWQTYRGALGEYNEHVLELLADIGPQMDVDPAQSDFGLGLARQQAEIALAEARARLRSTDRSVARASTASDLLKSASHACPTCLRPISEDERTVALRSHGEVVVTATADTAAATSELATAEQRLRVVDEFERRLGRLRLPVPPDHGDPGAGAETRLQTLRTSELELREQLGAARANRQAARLTLEKAQSDANAAMSLRQAAREELLHQTAASVLEAVADRYLTDRIEPLALDVAHRWKVLFGSEGLVLDPTGEVRLRRGEMDLALGDMSGGEGAIAGILIRILVSAATTRIPMVWFDEPLEHLDPRRRSGVAHTLVQAVAAGTVNQILVATYEEGIARRLALASPDLVTVVHADADPSQLL